jgi:hypothetical protein
MSSDKRVRKTADEPAGPHPQLAVAELSKEETLHLLGEEIKAVLDGARPPWRLVLQPNALARTGSHRELLLGTKALGARRNEQLKYAEVRRSACGAART